MLSFEWNLPLFTSCVDTLQSLLSFLLSLECHVKLQMQISHRQSFLFIKGAEIRLSDVGTFSESQEGSCLKILLPESTTARPMPGQCYKPPFTPLIRMHALNKHSQLCCVLYIYSIIYEALYTASLACCQLPQNIILQQSVKKQ